MLVVMLKICRLEDQVKDKFAERIQKRGKIFENTKKLCGKYTKMLITLYTSDDILGKLKIQTENFFCLNRFSASSMRFQPKRQKR